MSQKYDLGITAQYIIANKFNLEVPETVINKVKSALDQEHYNALTEVVDEIFDATTLQLVKCTSLSKDYSKVPYQFIASNGKTISIRCNKSNDKIAVRYLGQPGKVVINREFGEIYGSELNCANDYKHLFIEHTVEVLPMFVEAFFDADIIIWIYKDQKTNKFKYHYIDGNADVNLEFSKFNISHTRTISTWNNSNTIKYNDESLAEIQVFNDDESRTWIFRFFAGTLIKYIEKTNSNNETLGATAERTICDIFNLKWKKEDNLDSRYNVKLAYMLEDPIRFVFGNENGLPAPIEYVGSQKGDRLGNSKSPYDFILRGNKTLSLKTNLTGNKVCPPEIGQPSAETCYLYFKHFTEEDHIDELIFKKMVFEHIVEMLKMYMDFLFDSDYLLRICVSKRNSLPFDVEVYKKGYGKSFKWDKGLITFTKPTVEDWKESNTVKYDGVTIGEFQVHSNRNCFKFRFDLEGLKYIVNKKKIYVE